MNMRVAKFGVLFLIPMILTSAIVVGQTSTAVPRITDLFSTEETKKAGLSKLSPAEIAALNAAFFRLLTELNSKPDSRPSIVVPSSANGDDMDFYDSRARAVAYIAGDSDLTIYLWTGEPVAYLDEDSVYGFNGKHLGWLKSGAIYDHDGNLVAAFANRFKGTVATPPAKSFKQFRPFKSFKEFKPFKPFFGLSWSDTPARIFLLDGAK
jgi:4-fold beta-flower domain-containing protein